jgi:hypothetical protein
LLEAQPSGLTSIPAGWIIQFLPHTLSGSSRFRKYQKSAGESTTIFPNISTLLYTAVTGLKFFNLFSISARFNKLNAQANKKPTANLSGAGRSAIKTSIS